MYPQLKEKNACFVGGCVAKSGAYQLSSGEHQTLTGAILKTGGFWRFANKEKVLHARKGKHGNIKVTLVNADALFRLGEGKDPEVLPGDVIVVYQRDLSAEAGGREPFMEALKNSSVSARCVRQ
jgi:protein involved in polysaccharide export with SLBB domain